jgi:hypothetical protein
MAVKIEHVRAALREVGLNPTWITPARGPDGQVKVMISCIKEPEPDVTVPVPEPVPVSLPDTTRAEEMIPQPAPDRFYLRDFSDIPGIGPKTAEKLRKAGINTLDQFTACHPDVTAQLIGNHAATLIHEYIDDL